MATESLSSPQLGEIQTVNDQLGERLECLVLAEKRDNKRIEQLQKKVSKNEAD